MFEKRKRKKAAERRFNEAIAAEWASRGVVPRDSSGAAFREAVREAGLGRPGDPRYARVVVDVMAAAEARLSDEDRFIVTGGREGRDPFAEETS
jgi:hypothetical protein